MKKMAKPSHLLTEADKFTQLCKDLEHYSTPEWAIEEILKRELMPNMVVDPCAGTGIMGQHLRYNGYHTLEIDIHRWKEIETLDHCEDFLKGTYPIIEGNGVMMNPPFSKAVEFVEHALAHLPRKIICFQRFAWWESVDRSYFWHKNPPSRIWVCGNRADCWRQDIPQDEKGRRYDTVTGKIMAGTTTAHAFFVWERNHKGTQLGHIYKQDDKK